MASRPQYQINPEEQDIENLAESQANQGMGAGARQQLQNNSDRALATGANSILMGGGNANSISNLVDKSDNAYSQNSIYDDQVRLQNLDKLQTAYARMSADKDKQWDINNNQPYKDKLTANSQDLQYANGVINQGISGLGSAASGAAKSFASQGGGGSVPYTSPMSQTQTSGPAMLPASPGAQPQYQQVQIPSTYDGSYWGGQN